MNAFLSTAASIVFLASCASASARTAARQYDAGAYSASLATAHQRIAHTPADTKAWHMAMRAALALGDQATLARTYEQYVTQHGQPSTLLRELATSTIAQALASPLPEVRVVALRTVEQAELEALAAKVAALVEDSDDTVAATAAVAVINSYPGAAQRAGELLQSPVAAARRIALTGIARKVGLPAIEDLRPLLDDRDIEVQRAAIQAVGQLRDQVAAPQLRRLFAAGDRTTRSAAASALASLAVPDAAALAQRMLTDAPNEPASYMAAVTLLRSARAWPSLAELARGRGPNPVSAALALTPRDPALLQSALATMQKSASAADRAAAMNYTLTVLGVAAGLPALLAGLRDADELVQTTAARSLVHHIVESEDQPPAELVTHLQQQANSSDDALRTSALAALSRLGDAHARLALIALTTATLSDRQNALSSYAEWDLVTGGLVAALADSNAQLRTQAAALIFQLAH